MKAKDFRNLISRGLGSAILFLQENPPNRNKKYLKAIEYVCTNNTAYDAQVEGSRAEYLWEAIQFSGYSEYLQEYVLTSLLNATKPYDIQQMLHLSRRFAEDGNNTAREVMYKAFQYNEDWNTFIGADDIILLDGTEGFLYVADAIGIKILSDEEYYEDDWIMSIAEEELGKDNIHQSLSKASQTNLNVKAYVDSAISCREERTSHVAKRSEKTYEEIKNLINDKSEKHILHYIHWGYVATAEDRLKAAHDLLAENKKYKIAKYLKIFIRKPFPLDIEKLIKLANHKDKNISFPAMRVLSNIQIDQVHELAISKWNENPQNSDVLELLKMNYKNTDYHILQNLLLKKSNKYELHHICFLILDILKNNQQINCIDLLTQIYNCTYCSNCRRRAIEIMLQNKEIPDWVLKECKYDSNPDIRDLINNPS